MLQTITSIPIIRKAVLNGFYGNFSDRIQGLIAGKSVQDTLDDWYNAYAEEAKARNAEGF